MSVLKAELIMVKHEGDLKHKVIGKTKPHPPQVKHLEFQDIHTLILAIKLEP